MQLYWMLLVGFILISYAFGNPPGGFLRLEPRASKEGERLLRQAHEAFKKGDYQQAYQLAKKVYDKEGDVYVAWFLDRDLPSTVDPYDELAIQRAVEEYIRRHGGAPSLRRVILSSGALIVHSLFKLRRYKELEPYAIAILRKKPHAQIIRSLLDTSRRLQRIQQGKEPLDHTLLVKLADGREVIIEIERGRRERAGALYTPLDDIARILGLRLSQRDDRALLQGRGIEATVRVGCDQIQINGKNIKLPKPPYRKGVEILVPIELLQELEKAIQR